LLLIEEDAAERGFGSVLEEDVALFFAELGFEPLPLVVGRRAEVEMDRPSVGHAFTALIGWLLRL
jgi:hypothetical protein